MTPRSSFGTGRRQKHEKLHQDPIRDPLHNTDLAFGETLMPILEEVGIEAAEPQISETYSIIA